MVVDLLQDKLRAQARVSYYNGMVAGVLMTVFAYIVGKSLTTYVFPTLFGG